MSETSNLGKFNIVGLGTTVDIVGATVDIVGATTVDIVGATVCDKVDTIDVDTIDVNVKIDLSELNLSILI